MRNPLGKRLPRELKKDFKKYAVLLILMIFMIGIASGIYVGNDSMMAAIDESYELYNIEDGHFELKEEATEDLLASMPDNINIYEQFYYDVVEDIDRDGNDDATVRLFRIRTDINRACVNEGRLPEAEGEIAIDRMHASNNDIRIGDMISCGGSDYEVVGLIALSDYSTLFKKNSDMMFNAVDFDVALVTDEDFDTVDGTLIYQYAYDFRTAPESEAQEKEWSDDLVERIAVIAATGGYTSDKDEAEELADNVDEWTAYLEDIEAQSDELEARGEELEGRQAALEEHYDLVMAGDPEWTAEAQSLQDDAEALQADIDALASEQDRIDSVIDSLEALEEYDDDTNELTDFVPEYANQAIHFAPEDMGSDKSMMSVLSYVFIGVLAFVFAITTSNTIVNEAAVIGTLRSTGYTRGELLRHYMMLPITVTLLSAVFGNILGYTCFKNVAVSMYYNSYSLMTYKTIWNADAFIETTVIPLILMTVVNFIVIYSKLRLSPLKFLRRDLSTSKRKKAMRLPSISFMGRFRLRILLNNLGGYIVLLFGIAFVMLLLAFAIGLPETLDHYKSQLSDNMISPYQYILKDYKDEDDQYITTSDDSAERFSMTNLVTIDGVYVGEDISVYGFIDDSTYVSLPSEMADDEVYISRPYADKFSLESGDIITLKERYTDKTYTFKITGIDEYNGALTVFMKNDSFNKTFGNDEDSYSGFLARNTIDDLDQDYVYTVVTREDVMSLATQLDHSMGSMADYLAGVCMIMAVLIMYLLTKIIIEKNAGSISMVKVLGYENREINSLYILLTSIVVVVFAFLTSYLSVAGLKLAFAVMMYSMSGWFDAYISPLGMAKGVAILLAAYAIVAFFDMIRIKRIPLTDALKNVE